MRYIATVLFLLCTFPTVSVAYDRSKDLSPSQKTAAEISKKATQEQIDKIELIEGTPKRKFTKLQPVFARATGAMLRMDSAVKNLKKDAAKLGADAIIEFKFGSANQGSIGGANGFVYGASTVIPVCSGWAVKWSE